MRGSQTISLSVPAIEHRDEMDQLADFVDPRNRIGGLGIFTVDFKPQLPSVADIRYLLSLLSNSVEEMWLYWSSCDSLVWRMSTTIKANGGQSR